MKKDWQWRDLTHSDFTYGSEIDFGYFKILIISQEGVWWVYCNEFDIKERLLERSFNDAKAKAIYMVQAQLLNRLVRIERYYKERDPQYKGLVLD